MHSSSISFVKQLFIMSKSCKSISSTSEFTNRTVGLMLRQKKIEFMLPSTAPGTLVSSSRAFVIMTCDSVYVCMYLSVHPSIYLISLLLIKSFLHVSNQRPFQRHKLAVYHLEFHYYNISNFTWRTHNSLKYSMAKCVVYTWTDRWRL